MVGPKSIVTGVLTRRGDTYTEKSMWGTGRRMDLQTKERGLRRNHPCEHYDPRLLASRIARK